MMKSYFRNKKSMAVGSTIQEITKAIAEVRAGMLDPENPNLNKIGSDELIISTINGLVADHEEKLGRQYRILGCLYYYASCLLPAKDFKEWAQQNSEMTFSGIKYCVKCFLIVDKYPQLEGMDRKLLRIFGQESCPEGLRDLVAEIFNLRGGIFDIKRKDAIVLVAKVASGEWELDGPEVRNTLAIATQQEWVRCYSVKLKSLLKKAEQDHTEFKDSIEVKRPLTNPELVDEEGQVAERVLLCYENVVSNLERTIKDIDGGEYLKTTGKCLTRLRNGQIERFLPYEPETENECLDDLVQDFDEEMLRQTKIKVYEGKLCPDDFEPDNSVSHDDLGPDDFEYICDDFAADEYDKWLVAQLSPED